MGAALQTLYQHSPVWMQNLAVAAYGYLWKWRRQGGDFLSQVEAYQAREAWSADQWAAYQQDQLRRLLTHCYDQVPWYHDHFRAAGLDRRDLEAFRAEDLVKLPMVEKEDLRAHPDAFLAATARGKRLRADATSGSTGTPLVILMDAPTHRRLSAAYEARCRRWAGVDHRMSRAMIGGRMVVPKAASRPPFWRYNPAERQVYFSAFHIAPANVPAYVAALNRYQPDYLVGYASGHAFLARMIEDQGLAVHRPKAILTSSEKLTEAMRALLERVYRCPVFDGYSGSEACCLASECEHHGLHVSPDVGYLEVVGEDGRWAPAGTLGEIVATGFLNYDQPLVRYRTHDLAVPRAGRCTCGRDMPLLTELVGRLEDTVYGADGRQLVRFHGIFLDLPGVREGQVIQEAVDAFTIRLVAPDGLTEAHRALIQRRMFDRLGEVRLTLERVDAIERTRGGKFKAVICNLSAEEKRRLSQLQPVEKA